MKFTIYFKTKQAIRHTNSNTGNSITHRILKIASATSKPQNKTYIERKHVTTNVTSFITHRRNKQVPQDQVRAPRVIDFKQ